MLGLFRGTAGDCRGMSRRYFLEVGSISALGLSLPSLLRARAALAGQSVPDVSCILLWTQGGTSHHDTVDPKPDAPQEIRGEFGPISTAIPGVRFTEQVPRLAASLNDYTLLRGLNPRNGDHERANAYMMTGYEPSPTITYPCYGSVVAYLKGTKAAMPPFVQVGNNMFTRFGSGTAGFLGIAYNPFEVPGDPSDDQFTVRDISLTQGIAADRLARRRTARDTIDNLQRNAQFRPNEFDALDEHYRTAFSMITSPQTRMAFELKREEPQLRDRYGRSEFGQRCLLARRLIEAGVRFVTVTNGGWDHHSNIFAGLKSRLPPVDQAIPALFTDLKERGLLSSTLVVWMTDFGRTPKVNHHGGRDHWSSASFAILAGAGVPGGAVIGKTDDSGSQVVRDQYFTEDLAATIYAKLRIPLERTLYTPDDRPVQLCHGRPIPGLMGAS